MAVPAQLSVAEGKPSAYLPYSYQQLWKSLKLPLSPSRSHLELQGDQVTSSMKGNRKHGTGHAFLPASQHRLTQQHRAGPALLPPCPRSCGASARDCVVPGCTGCVPRRARGKPEVRAFSGVPGPSGPSSLSATTEPSPGERQGPGALAGRRGGSPPGGTGGSSSRPRGCARSGLCRTASLRAGRRRRRGGEGREEGGAAGGGAGRVSWRGQCWRRAGGAPWAGP